MFWFFIDYDIGIFLSIKAPVTDVQIKKPSKGFYKGYNLPVAVSSKVLLTALVMWALIWPTSADRILSAWNESILHTFNTFYVISVGLFTFFLFTLAIIPSVGRRKLGDADTVPEFSNFSWFSMMFGAGLGVGLMVFATAEPLGLLASNPDILDGTVTANTADAVKSAYRYTFLHYGFHAWAIYVVTGLSLAYYAYTRNMPLTIRSALTPLLGKWTHGALGNIVDAIAVIATTLGVSVTIGFGVSQCVEGIYAVTSMEWLMGGTPDAPKPSTVGLVAALIVIMSLSILSAVSGVGRGIKYLSNLNLILSLILLSTFIFFGSFAFAMNTFVQSLLDYIINFVPLSFTAYGPQSLADFSASIPTSLVNLTTEDIASVYSGATNAWGSLETFSANLPASITNLDNSEGVAQGLYAAGTQGRQFEWQKGWSTFYWAWWIAFSPLVGLFLARISKGRTIREFILGCVIAPAIVCFLWMTILGGTAIDLELSNLANGEIIAATNTAKLFVTLEHIISGDFLTGINIMSVVLLSIFLVTSADSGILVINTITSGGQQETDSKRRIIWGLILTTVIGSLLIAGNSGAETNPFSALQNAMIIGALPFAFIMLLMMISLAKAIYRDGLREKQTNIK